jgi:hypothetical protein
MEKDIGFIAAGLLPDFQWVQYWQDDFLSAGFVGLIPDNVFNLDQYPPAQRQKRIYAGG